MKIFKKLCILICTLFVMLFCTNIYQNNNEIETSIRTIELVNQKLDSESYFSNFDSYEINDNDGIFEFVGTNEFSLSELCDLDLVACPQISDLSVTTKYFCDYDYENSIVSLSIAFVNGDNIEVIDKIYGVLSLNDNNEFDVAFDVEGDIVFLSELDNVEIIENCGFFKKLFNKAKEVVANKVNNVVNTTKKVLSTNAGKIGTIVTVGACAVAGAVCAVVPGCQVGTAVFVGMAIGYVGGATTAAVSTYQQDGKVDWNAVNTYAQVGAVVGGAVSGLSYGATKAISSAISHNKTITKEVVTKEATQTCKINKSFKNEDLLKEHFEKHSSEFEGMFKTSDEYLKGANYVIENGTYVPEMNGYIRFFGAEGKVNYAFVGMTSDGSAITTFGLRSAQELAKKIPWIICN